MARMFNPPHPGLTLRDDVLPALGLKVTEAAQQLGVSRVALSRVLNGRAAISPDMALRIEAWLGVARGGEARLWLAEQSAYAVTANSPTTATGKRLIELTFLLLVDVTQTPNACPAGGHCSTE